MSTTPSEVSSLMIPLGEKSLLVPNSCIVEVVPKAGQLSTSGEYPWLLGDLSWRNLTLPCISFEHLSGTNTEPAEYQGSVAIFNTMGDAFAKRFYAMSIYGIPRLARVTEEEIVEDSQVTNAYEKLYLKLNGESCVIPDVDAIETLLASTHFL